MTPTKDDFDAWKANPMTEWVMAGVQRYADGQKAFWGEQSWSSGLADQAALDRMKTRADAYEGLAQLNFEQAMGLHEQAEEPAA
jgi:hypothetical protein